MKFRKKLASQQKEGYPITDELLEDMILLDKIYSGYLLTRLFRGLGKQIARRQEDGNYD